MDRCRAISSVPGAWTDAERDHRSRISYFHRQGSILQAVFDTTRPYHFAQTSGANLTMVTMAFRRTPYFDFFFLMLRLVQPYWRSLIFEPLMKLQGASGDVLGRPRAVAMAWPWPCSLRSSSDIDEHGPADDSDEDVRTHFLLKCQEHPSIFRHCRCHSTFGPR